MASKHLDRLIGAIIGSICLAGMACRDPVSSVRELGPGQRNAAQVEWSGNPELAQLIAAVRDATDQYHDVNAALAAGYRPSAAGYGQAYRTARMT